MPTRRAFVSGVGAAVLVGCSESSNQPTRTAADEPPAPSPPMPNAPSKPAVKRPDPAAGVPKRKLGRTGVEVSMVGLGGYHLGKAESAEAAAKVVHHAVDRGITFLDNCWDYHDGKSEDWMGRALTPEYRARVFLMTKTDGHTKQACAAQIEQSLKRLRTDVIDLVQVHEVIRMGDPDAVFAKGGAIEALLEAKKAGKLRFIGFTGHKHPDMHLAMLARAKKEGFTFDAVQLPLNPFDAHFRSFEQAVLPVLVRENIAVLGMKALCAGKALAAGVEATDCLHYAMNLPTSVVITGCETVERVDQAVAAAQTLARFTDASREALLAKTKPYAGDGKLEEFKTTKTHDGTIEHPLWLTGATY